MPTATQLDTATAIATAPPGSQITQDGQIEWAGLLMGPGTPYQIDAKGLTGWDDLPELDSADVPKPDQHGSWPGAQWAKPRTVSATVWLLPDRLDQARAVARAFRAATAVHSGEQWFAVRLHGQTLACRARVDRRVVPTDRTYVTQGIASVSIQWLCADPRRLGVTEQQGRTVLPAPEPGLLWQPDDGLEWPLGWGEAGSTGVITAVNEGDAPVSPVIEFHGPVDLPSLTRLSDGRQLEYDIQLAEADVLTVDTTDGTVLLNGTTSRLYTATNRSTPEQLFQLEPGDTSLAFRAGPDSTDPRASVTVRWRDAHW
ncbi:phage tail protein [Streptomyces sp. NPDC037389]|uniref:phage distal tail protein n=1 Tax=Streptomyces sp. NPDC037389 TaxID=3155369 RepID=UPI0033D094BF